MRRRRPISTRGARWRRWAVIAARLAVLGLLVGFAGLELVVRWQPYDVQALGQRPVESHRVLDRDGRVLRERVNPDGLRVRWTPLEAMSPWVAEAVLAVEDARFYTHDGVDWHGVGRAVADSLVAGRPVSGASTVTMQLARLLRPHAKTLWGKLGEMVDARRLERAVSKRTVLEQYLNRVPSGAGTVGIEAASHRYFGVPSRELTLAQAALLAGLPAAPSRLDPVRNPTGARARQLKVLRRMLVTGRIDLLQWREAVAEPSVVSRHDTPLHAPHFTERVLAAGPPAGDVETTLDRPLQREIEAAVSTHVEAWGPRGVRQAAVVVLDNARCEVLTLVGSREWGEASAQGAVNGALALRQPGSTLKPFTYALAFEGGAGPGTVVPDVPTHYVGHDGAVHSPRNYGRRTSGPVMMGDALARSLNIPAIRTLADVGVGALLDRLRALGFDSLDQPAGHYGLGLTLGNGEVTLLELAQGFAALARGGTSCRARLRPDAATPLPGEVFRPDVAHAITTVLADEGLRARAFGVDNALMLGQPMAIKTGTSANWRDSWAIGYTAEHTVAVWTGDFEGRSMNQLTGVAGAGPLLRRVAERVFARFGPPRLPSLRRGAPRPQRVAVCALSGRKPGPHCPHRRSVLALEPVDPRHDETCSWHREVLVDPHDGGLAGPQCPAAHAEPQVVEVLPTVYARWEALAGRPAPPTRLSEHCPADGAAVNTVAVTWPRSGEVFVLEPGYDEAQQRLPLRATVDPPAPEATWTVDGRVVEHVGWPYTASWALAPGRHELRVSAGGRTSAPVAFEVR